MKRLFSICFLTVISCFIVSAQEISTCPQILIKSPANPTPPGSEMIFTAAVEGNAEGIIYDWSINSGTIIEGQGTSTIRVIASGISEEKITATVKIIGLPQNCVNSASADGYLLFCGLPYAIDDYGEISFSEEMIRLTNVAETLKKEKGVATVFIIYATEKDNLELLKARTLKIYNYLTENQRLSKESVRFVFGGSDLYRTAIYIYPTMALGDSWTGWLKVLDNLKSQRRKAKSKTNTNKK